MAQSRSWQIEDVVPDEEEASSNTENEPTQRLIDALLNKLPSKTPNKVKFTEFDVSKINPKAWIKTAQLIAEDAKPNKAQLARALTESFKGSSAEWLADNLDENLTWENFLREILSH
ncbi:hypothetical protein GE061_008226 [Apolygus lucorum]|uniref:Uncharacterized protein n=1 Tax=Apolygus lucorum TaxID=248454 RepID=A0A8S9WQS2_APOLU|nr:hypothetical protein GE061_008226 [Apolygus lucorum]